MCARVRPEGVLKIRRSSEDQTQETVNEIASREICSRMFARIKKMTPT